ncbi:hypothetical protein E1B28_003606 [Marasmius oreades]|uniref:Uncharacterized protein n=1 Tax=Marasmius oreades TaxID=181124 RepID=A0A9P7RMW5_9AGAR|nr:uncharacterized protein E1B28_003606 [Marasmius oreades]KAG7086091.1 hypothetical protein E1B28_003606 [Marasmius oreades]
MDSETIEQRLAPYLSTRSILVYPITTLSVMFLLYGISVTSSKKFRSSPNLYLPGLYIPLFGLSIRILWRRNNAISKLYLGFVITLFVLATLDNACVAAQLIRQALLTLSAAKTKDYGDLVSYLHEDNGKTALSTITNLTDILMNAVADFMLVLLDLGVEKNDLIPTWACCLYYQWYCFFLPFPAPPTAHQIWFKGTALGSLIASAIGFSDTSVLSNAMLFVKANRINDGSWLAVAACNLILTLLMAARIWWITREAREVMGKPIENRYRKIVAVILESGFLYTSTLLVSLVVGLEFDPDDHGGSVPIDLGVVVSTMSGIAPTLIIVRFAYGLTVDGPGNFVQTGRVSTLQFATRSDGMPGSTSASTESPVQLPTDGNGDDVLVAATVLEKV